MVEVSGFRVEVSGFRVEGVGGVPGRSGRRVQAHLLPGPGHLIRIPN